MNSGAFGENFPYSNFHDLNMDWIIKIAKDFLDQYTHIQQIISEGEESLTNLTTDGLTQLQEKADNLEALLQQWYDTHSADIANQLTQALADLASAYNTTISAFNASADAKMQALLNTIPADFSELLTRVNTLISTTNEDKISVEYDLANSLTLDDYDLDFGYVDNQTGEIVSSNLNIVMRNIILFGRGTTFCVPTGYLGTLIKYNKDLSYNTYQYVNGGRSVTITDDTFIRVTMRTEPPAVISDKSAVAQNMVIYPNSAFSKTEQLNTLKNYCELTETDYTVIKPIYKQGFLTDHGTELFNFMNMITTDILFIPKNSRLYVDTGARCAIHFFNNKGVWQTYAGVAPRSQYIFTEDSYVRIGMYFVDLHEFTDPSIPNNYVFIYKHNTYNWANILMNNLRSNPSEIKLKWEYGYIGEGGNPVYGANINIKTVGNFFVGAGTTISIPNGIMLTIHYYDMAGNWQSFESLTDEHTKVFASEQLIALSARYTEVAGITNISDVSELVHINLLIKNNADANANYWKGKKIVWFGTSIPAGVVNTGGANGNGSYPTRVGEMLGATVYNESVGMSEVRAGTHGSYVTQQDPMGYGGVSAPGLMLSLSLSSAEKQSIYDNWETKWKNIITWYQDQLDMSRIETYKNASWDKKLTKYLTGGSVGQCDVYVFDHGYNDPARDEGFTELDDIPTDPKDRRYWFGAMEFLFSKIYADNPNAQIIIIGHYSLNQRSGNFNTKYLCEAQKKLAEYWSLPLVKTWKNMGFSFHTITENGQSITPALSWLPDGIHPASDPTGKSLQHYAMVLYPMIKELK